MNFGEVIKKYRKTLGLTQKEFAKKIGITRDVLAKWETNKTFPRFETLINLFQIIPPCALFSQYCKKIKCQEGNLRFSEDKFLVFPKITIFCPKSGKEERGDKCFNCEHFKGVKVDREKRLLWFECGFQESGNDG